MEYQIEDEKIKELTRDEVIDKLKNEICFHGFVKDDIKNKWNKALITGIDFYGHENRTKYLDDNGGSWYICGLEIK